MAYDKRDNSCCSMNNCFFCCCLPLKPSVVITTISIIVSLIIAIILNLIFYHFDSGIIFIYIVYIIVIISLILLLIGIKKVNIPFMKQFKIVFFLFLIFQTVLMVYDIINRFKDTVQIINGKEKKTSISTFFKIIIIILAILNFIILVCYYFATCRYINEVERDVDDIERRRRLEERRK